MKPTKLNQTALLLLIIFSGILQLNAKPKKGFTKLFNSKDLSGWSVKCLPADKDKSFWKVVDGTIECNSLDDARHDYIWLMHEKEFGDFELKLKFQAFKESPGNSGVQFRSRYNANEKADGGFWLDGPQVDIDPGTQWRVGLIYDETWGEKRWICPSLKDWKIEKSNTTHKVKFNLSTDKNPWNELRIVCKGNQVTTFLNGNQVVDFDGKGVLNNAEHIEKNIDKRGYIALQLHNTDKLKMRYKDIYIREL